MSLLHRIHHLALGAALLIAAAGAARSSRTSDARSFETYRLAAPPQTAQGDFDGDGRIDTAVIQERDGGNRLSIKLSASGSTVELESAVVGVVQGDIDQDGDLDLIAATSSGELLIWLNDGHGEFTRQVVSTTGALSTEPTLGDAATQESVAVIDTPISLPPAGTHRLATIADRLLPSVRSVAAISGSVIPPPLRAPPSPSA